jgi:hypothetical protein
MNKNKFKPSDFLGIKDPSQILHYVRKWSSSLNEKEHIIKSVVQEIHQNLEIKLDRILYKLLTYQTPKGTSGKDVDETNEEIWEEIGKLGFEQKYRLLNPILKKWKQVRPEITEISNINVIRRQCTHLKNKDKIQYKGLKIFSDPEGIAMLFVDAWGIGKGLDDLWEWIDDQHARIEKGMRIAFKAKGAF